MYSILILLYYLSITIHSSYLPTKYSMLQQLNFSHKVSMIAHFSQDIQMLLIGFQGESHNVSIYLVNLTEPKHQLQGKKGAHATYYFYDNITDATGNITSISTSNTLGIIGIGCADHIFRIYSHQINKNKDLKIIKYQELTDSYGPITFSSFSTSGSILAVVGSEDIVRFYINLKNNQSQKTQNRNFKDSKSKYKLQNSKFQLFQNLSVHNDIISIAFSFNETTFYIGYENGSLVGYHFNNKQNRYQFAFTITDTNRRITSIATNQNGNILATGSQDGFVRIYKSDNFNNNPKLFQGIYDANKSISKVSLRPDGKLIVITSSEGWTRIYNDYGKFQLNQSLSMNHNLTLDNVLSQKGNMIATVEGNKIKIYQSCISSLFQCSECSSLDKCQRCENNYFLSRTDGFCHVCSLLQGCKTCISQNMCTSCYSGYYLNSQQGICESCVNTLKNCKSCQSKFQCSQCFLQFKLNNGVCKFPVDPNIPILIPLSNSSKPFIDKVKQPVKAPINIHKWTITLIILIIILCCFIIAVLVAMIILYVKLMNKVKMSNINPYNKQQKLQHIYPNSQRTMIHCTKNQLINGCKQMDDKVQQNNSQQSNNPTIPCIQPEEKKQDDFKQLRP